MDFSNFKAVDSANLRKNGTFVKEQSYEDMKYRRVTKEKTGITEGRFFISNKRWEELGLEGAFGLRQFTGPNGEIVLGVVAEDDAKMLRSKENAGKKGRNFKAVVLEMALEKAGVITTTNDQNQYLKLTKVAENVKIGNVEVKQAFTISVGTKKEAKVKVTEPSTDATPVAAQPIAQPVNTPPATKAADWD